MKGLTFVQPGLACCGIGVQFPVEYAAGPTESRESTLKALPLAT